MTRRLAALWLTAAALMRIADAVGPVVQCGPCDPGALEQCKPLPANCVEKVREPGCGCCMTCALAEGELCGVYTRRCGAGMTCQLQPGEARQLQALLEGRGVCSKTALKKTPRLPPAGRPEHPGLTEEPSGSRAATPDPRIVTRVPEHRTPHHNPKAEVIRREQTKKTHSFKVQPVPEYEHKEVHNFSVDFRRELEYGPCRTAMISILKRLKASDTLNPRRLSIPNCDKKGFYKKKQCRPSKGRKRGICWCVDRYGQTLPGFDGSKKDGTQCQGLDNK
ncbi:insulin-like growth factor-binding protein 3 isoform X2 [Paramormyrops kingsleyae]|uniref:insulin-like growth factor-binding protein 3 isoform X2 n=1 Tax=Paramormyrops kingsleyae TaxID=1676925 RepID=UPI000CD64798|nr:insulin-like growth factor-binding protein 3 isoform X2 [Paramormyrops kingsleyae]